jgi:hypothetical protein
MTVEDHGGVIRILWDIEKAQLEPLPIGDPRGMIRSDQLSAALDCGAARQIMKRQHAAAQPVACLEQLDIETDTRQLVRGREPGESATDDSDSAAARPSSVKGVTAQEQSCGAQERLRQHLAAGRTITAAIVSGAQPAKELTWHGYNSSRRTMSSAADVA